MVSRDRKSSFKEEEEEISKAKEKVAEPIPPQSVPMEEVTSKTTASQEKEKEESTAVPKEQEVRVQGTTPGEEEEEGEQPNPVERTTPSTTQDEERAPSDMDGFLPTKKSKKNKKTTEDDAASTKGDEAFARELQQQEVLAANAIQQKTVGVLGNAISKFRNVYEQIEDNFVRSILLGSLEEIAFFFRLTDDGIRRELYIEPRFEIALWFGPDSQLGCCSRLLYGYTLRVPTEWRKQVKDLEVALKALTAVQASFMSWEMDELLNPRLFRQLRSYPTSADEKVKEERSTKTESTDSDSEFSSD